MAVAVDAAAFSELESGFTGVLVRPTDDSFEELRKVWNGSIDRHPALIARCAGADDIAAATRFARRTGLPVAVRGGGHSFPGHSVCDDGIVIDLAPMKGITVDPEARTVRVQAGALLGELDRATQPFGLAVPSGIVTHTGVAGLTLGGGIGWVMRKYGLSIDQLSSVELITADGELVVASEAENADLFWGVRGGGGNFGIVTAFDFHLCEVGPTVVAGPIFWPIEQSPQVLRFYRDWIADAPDELMTIVIHRKAPPLPFVPPELHGKLIVGVVCCYTGPVEEGERVVRPIKDFGSPVLDLCVPKPFVDHQAMFDPSFPHGRWYYFRSCDVAELSDEVIDITVEHSQAHPVAVDELPHLAVRRRGGEGRRRGDGLHRPQGRAHLQHQRGDGGGRGLRCRTRMGPRVLVGPEALPHERLHELPHGGGRGTHPPGLRAGEVRPAQGAQAQVRPRQPLPAQPEHPARLTASDAA